MENEKYLLELSDAAKLIAFNKEWSTYDHENKYFTSVKFITSGDTQFIQQRLEEDIFLFYEVSDVLGVQHLKLENYIEEQVTVASFISRLPISSFT